jgi:hypothetical protein
MGAGCCRGARWGRPVSVADLIAELQKLPQHAPVWVDQAGWDDDERVSVEVDAVTWEGSHVLIQAWGS